MGPVAPTGAFMDKRSFLIVEDEGLIALHTKQILEGMGQHVTGIALSGEEALEMAGTTVPDVVVMDIILDGQMSGIDAAEELQRRHGTPFIFLSGNLDQAHMVRIEKLKHFGFISKPADMGALELAIRLSVKKTGKK